MQAFGEKIANNMLEYNSREEKKEHIMALSCNSFEQCYGSFNPLCRCNNVIYCLVI